MPRKELLIIFYRNPELGKVKTRLAATLGDAGALAIYLKLVNHTKEITSSLPVDRVVYYTNFIDKEDNWPNEKFDKQLQVGETLGDRMRNAVQEGFRNGYESVCIIGTDCLEMTEEIIGDAFELLNKSEVVIGPAKDGGYYLLGAASFHQEFFQNKVWSSDSVFKDTLEDCKKLQLAFELLPILSDVDEAKDLPKDILNLVSKQKLF